MTHFIHSRRLAAVAAAMLAGASGFAHESHEAAKPHAAAIQDRKPWGIAGRPRDVQRTIAIAMGDDMRFTPQDIDVRQGETIRFVLRNGGKLMHEMVLGNAATLAEHAAMMRKHPGMAHREPSMAHVAAGRQGELLWKFDRAGEFDFACLIPGHYEAGMKGRIRVAPAG